MPVGLFGQEPSVASIESETLLLESLLSKHLGDDEEQIKYLKTCIANDRTNPNYYYQLARYHKRADDLREALTYAEKAAKLDKTNKWFALLTADIHEELLDFLSANKYLSQAASVTPNDEMLQFRIAQNFMKNGNAEKCLTTLRAIEQKFGQSDKASYQMLDILNSKEQYDEGLELLNNLTRLYPNNTSHLNNLANQYLLKENPEKAEEVYRKVLTIDPANPQANAHIVHADVKGAKDSEYLYAISPLIENSNIPFDNKVLELIPYVEQLQVDKDPNLVNALHTISNKLVALYPNEAKAHALRGDVMYLSGELETSLKSYDKTLQLNDKVYMVWIQKMNLLYDMQDYVALLDFSEKAIDYYPNNYEGYMWQSLAQLASGEIAEAKAYTQDIALVGGSNTEAQQYAKLIKVLIEVKEDQIDTISDFVKANNLAKSNNPIELHLVAVGFQSIGDEDNYQKFLSLAEANGHVSIDINQQ